MTRANRLARTAFLLALTTTALVAWFAVPDVPGVVEAMAVGAWRAAGYLVIGCIVVALGWRWIERAL